MQDLDRTPSEGRTLEQVLIADHDELRRRLAEARAAVRADDDPRRPARLYDLAVAGLSGHLAASETSLHRVVRRRLAPAGAGLAEQVRVDRELVRLLRFLEQRLWGDMRGGSLGVEELGSRLAERLEAHAAAEESLVAQLRPLLSEEEQARVLKAFETAAHRGPTRPHPYAPHTPGLVRWAFRLNASWDRVLDLMDVRSSGAVTPRRTRPATRWGAYALGQAHAARPPDPPGPGPTGPAGG